MIRTAFRPAFAAALWLAAFGDIRSAEPIGFPTPDRPTFAAFDEPYPRTAEGLVPVGGEATFVAPEVEEAAEPELVARPDEAAALSPVVPSPSYLPHRQAAGRGPEWQILPQGVLFRSFVAGVHQPRMAAEVVTDRKQGGLFDNTLGGRIALFRHGGGPDEDGFEVQVAAAAFTRLSFDREMDVESADYVAAVPLVWRRGDTAFRIGYDHLSAHAGDELMIRRPDFLPGFERRNYVRDSIEAAVAQRVLEDFLVYGSANYAFARDGGAGPWHFQFGAEYQPFVPPGWHGAPVVAVNTLLRQEFDYQGTLGVVAGWQWRGLTTTQLLRLGLSFYTGKSRQFEYYDLYETLTGVGLWYDF